MWNLLNDLLFLSIGMAVGVMLMCMLSVSKQADERMEHSKESENVTERTDTE